MIVVDANVVTYHLLRADPFADEVTRLAETDPDWVAPTLLRSELRNVLALQHRERGLSVREAKRLLRQAEALFDEALFEVDGERVLDLVAQSELSAYDCEYLVLAQRLNTSLVTYDTAIQDSLSTIAYAPSDVLDE
jgi:predicted nucleic acid-binding protein